MSETTHGVAKSFAFQFIMTLLSTRGQDQRPEDDDNEAFNGGNKIIVEI